MKLEKMMRATLMLAAMAAGLVFVEPVRAQQETEPTMFEAAANQNGPGFNQPAAVTAQVTVANASSTEPVQAADEAAMTSAASFDINAVLGLVVAASVIALLGIAESVKGSRRRTSKVAKMNAWASGTTVN